MDLADAVGRAQQGDAEAFRLLYRDIQPRLLRYLHAIAGQDAEDIASETWGSWRTGRGKLENGVTGS